MKNPIFYLLALLLGASFYFNAPTNHKNDSKSEQLDKDKAEKIKSPIVESTSPEKNNVDNDKTREKSVNLNQPLDLSKSSLLNEEQVSFAEADGAALQNQFISENEDITWKSKEEDFYRMFYAEWLSSYPETNTEIEIECKSQHCKLKLNSIVTGAESFKALTSFIKHLAKSGRPFNLLKFKPNDDFAEIMTLRVED